eukprot:scaffold77397_cov61-Phaeocystis_antarctica.AAC.3
MSGVRWSSMCSFLTNTPGPAPPDSLERGVGKPIEALLGLYVLVGELARARLRRYLAPARRDLLGRRVEE